MIRAAAVGCLVLIALLAAGCRGGGGDPEGPAFESQPLSLEMQAMLEEVAAVRGLPAPTGLRIGAVPRARVAEFVDSRLTEAERADLDQLTILFRLQGHLPPTQDLREAILQLLSDFAIGFYSPEDRTMWLVRDQLELDPARLSEQERSTLAHEFVHALQDNAFDLQRLKDEVSYGSDAGLARDAVIEGDAVAHERLWLEAHLAVGRTRAFILASASMSSLPPSIERELRFPYDVGVDWVGAVRAASGQQAIDRILRDRRPMTSTEIMRPTVRDTGWLPVEVGIPDIAPALGGGWTQVGSNTLGEFRLSNYLQLWLPGLQALGAANGWTGDRFALYSDGSATLATFRVKFTTAKDAGEFAQAHLALMQTAGAQVEQRVTDTVAEHRDGRVVIQLRDTAEDEVVFVIASTRDAAESAAAILARP